MAPQAAPSAPDTQAPQAPFPDLTEPIGRHDGTDPDHDPSPDASAPDSSTPENPIPGGPALIDEPDGTTPPSPEGNDPAPQAPDADGDAPGMDGISDPIGEGIPDLIPGGGGAPGGGFLGGQGSGISFLGIGLPLPSFLTDAAAQLGFAWPQSDEMQLFAIGKNHVAAGMEFMRIRGEVNDATDALLSENESDDLEAFGTFQSGLSTHMMVSGISAPALGVAYIAAGALVLALKIQMLMILAEAAIAMATRSFGFLLGPLGALGGMAQAAAQLAALRAKVAAAIAAVQAGMTKVLDIAAQVVEEYTKVMTPKLQNRPMRKESDPTPDAPGTPMPGVPDRGAPVTGGPAVQGGLVDDPAPTQPADPAPVDTAPAPESDGGDGTDIHDQHGGSDENPASTDTAGGPPGDQSGGGDASAPEPEDTTEPADPWDGVDAPESDPAPAAGGGEAPATGSPSPTTPQPPSTSDLNPEMGRG